VSLLESFDSHAEEHSWKIRIQMAFALRVVRAQLIRLSHLL
jgi:hypothetical protein